MSMQDEKQNARLHVAALQEAREHGDDNPLALWEMYKLCRVHNLPVPPEVLAYLDGVGAELLDPKHADKRGKKVTASIAEQALGLHTGKGRGTRFAEHHKPKQEIDIECRMDALIAHTLSTTGKKLTQDEASEIIGRDRGIGKRAAEDAYSRWHGWWDMLRRLHVRD